MQVWAPPTPRFHILSEIRHPRRFLCFPKCEASPGNTSKNIYKITGYGKIWTGFMFMLPGTVIAPTPDEIEKEA